MHPGATTADVDGLETDCMIHHRGDSSRQLKVVPALLLMASLLIVLGISCQSDDKTPQGKTTPAALARAVVSEPRDGALEVPVTTTLRISIDGPIDHEAVERSLAIEPRVAGTSTWEADTLVFSPTPGWQIDTRYRVGLSIPSSGDKPERAWTVEFTTLSSPRVVTFSPGTGQKDTRTDTPLVFEFNRSVDEQSFLRHLDVSPKLSGKVVRSGNTLTYIPIERMKTGLRYSVVLGAGVTDSLGLKTTKETRFQFTTMESPRVVSVSPSANTTANGSTIAVEFDRPMNKESVEGAFSLYPAVQGRTSWEGNTLLFVADSLSSGTRYTIRIVPGAVRDVDENYLLNVLQSDFIAGGTTALVSAPKPSPTATVKPSPAPPAPTPITVASAARGPAPQVPAPALAPPPPTATAVAQPTRTPVPPATPTPSPSPTAAPVSVAELLSPTEDEVLASHNALRKAAGLPALSLDPRLIEMARYRSADMARRGYFSHVSPDGSTVFTIMDARGIRYAWAGENLALNDAKGHQAVEIAMTGWMNSEGHRANILNPKFDRVGIALATNPKGVNYFTVVFMASP